MRKRVLFTIGAVLFAVVAVVFTGYAADSPVVATSLEIVVGGGVSVSVTPLRVDGLDVMVDASTSDHPGNLRFRVVESGIYNEVELGAASWRSTAGQPAKEIVTVHLSRQPSSKSAILRLQVSAVSASVGLMPALDGTLQVTPATGCGAPLADPPTSAAIRARLKEVSGAVPDGVAPLWQLAAAVPDSALADTFASAVRTVRCASPGRAPQDPAKVPAEQIKLWLTSVVLADGSPWAVLRPLVESAPAEALRWGYLQAEALRHGQAAPTIKSAASDVLLWSAPAVKP